VDGAAIRRARTARGLTQHQLARILDVAGGERISLWELGQGEPRAELVPRLATALGVPPRHLLSIDGPVDLRALRLAAGLTTAQVAAAVPVSRQTFEKWETGKQAASPAARPALAAVLGVGAEEVAAAAEAARRGAPPR
jgi:transcriptional regulator with XRE-family HTH domain